jgi:hypothetical protein
MENARNLNDLTGGQLFQLRTNSKRAHTRLVTRINGLIGRRASKLMLERKIAALADSLANIRNINDHYIIVARLDAQEQRDAEEYVQQLADQITATCGHSSLLRNNSRTMSCHLEHL